MGGAVVAIYTEGAYRSGDLDFVLLTYLNNKLPKVMKEIGFEVSHSRHFSHPKCTHLIVDFASGPPGIGEGLGIKPFEVKSEGQIIKIYSPTDCIRDRLSYIHFKASECLEQAWIDYLLPSSFAQLKGSFAMDEGNVCFARGFPGKYNGSKQCIAAGNSVAANSPCKLPGENGNKLEGGICNPLIYGKNLAGVNFCGNHDVKVHFFNSNLDKSSCAEQFRSKCWSDNPSAEDGRDKLLKCAKTVVKAGSKNGKEYEELMNAHALPAPPRT